MSVVLSDTVLDMSNLRLLTIRDVSQILQISSQTLYKMIEAGEIPAIRIGNQWRFEEEQLYQWIRQSATNSQTPRG